MLVKYTVSEFLSAKGSFSSIDSTDREFWVSSGRLLKILVEEGRNEF